MNLRTRFLSVEDRRDLILLAKDGSAEHRLARRANALVLLDDGWSCQQVAKALFLDDDTIRTWRKLFDDEGFDGLLNFDVGGSACRLTSDQQDQLKAWITERSPRSTRVIGAWIKEQFGFDYEGRSGLVMLLKRLGCTYRKPTLIPRQLSEEKQQHFIESYENQLNTLGADEVVVFVDAVHPTHEARAAGCWSFGPQQVALEQTSGRERLNIHGAINLETGQTKMIEAPTIDALSTIKLLQSLEASYATMACIHVYLDNARYHHAKAVRAWLSRPDCRIKLHFVPAYCPHLNPIERLWGLMHRHITHNKCYATCRDFADATFGFLRETVPKKWTVFCDSVTDNFRIIKPGLFRVLA